MIHYQCRGCRVPSARAIGLRSISWARDKEPVFSAHVLKSSACLRPRDTVHRHPQISLPELPIGKVFPDVHIVRLIAGIN